MPGAAEKRERRIIPASKATEETTPATTQSLRCKKRRTYGRYDLWNLLLGILDKATLTLGDNGKADFSSAMIFRRFRLFSGLRSQVKATAVEVDGMDKVALFRNPLAVGEPRNASLISPDYLVNCFLLSNDQVAQFVVQIIRLPSRLGGIKQCEFRHFRSRSRRC
jgi:hypothetical protein